MEEELTIVNNKNTVIGWGRKEEIEYLDMSFRCVNIIVFLKEDTLILPRFSMNKKKFPNRLTSSAVGHVNKYESYENAAKRCLWGCLGIKTEILKDIGEFSIIYGKSIIFHKIYSIQLNHEDKIILNPLEFQGYEKKSISQIEKEISKGGYEYTQSFIKSFEFIKREKRKLFAISVI
ncbi:hypothetical protein KO317_01140 [Candidatus Micrarchaeota archaeon]|nr:hypothetical protein [Candidatus Micrarchaeota archaeon]